MDGLSLSAVVHELTELIGGRIEKVQQPERDELLISIHSAGGSNRLLISASPENCRILITDEKKPSPVDAPAFLMLLRKHLTGARIRSVSQPNMDRLVEFEIETLSELQDPVVLKLICEIMGRHSNIILVDSDGNVVDAIRRVGPSVSSARLILPRIKYEYPPSKKKLDPREAAKEDFIQALSSVPSASRALSDTYYGLSPAVASKLTEALGYPECGFNALSEKLCSFYKDFNEGHFSPCIVSADGKSVMTLPFRPSEEYECEFYPTMSEAISAYYLSHAQEESIRRRTSGYEHVIKNAISKLERKLIIFDEAISSDEDNERIKRYGELLIANLYSVSGKSDRAVVTDYYSDPPLSVEIPLDPKLSAAENAQKYFTRYRKAKLARDHALEMKKQASDEISYLDELLYTLSCCEGESELNEIRQELIAGGYLSDDWKKQKKASPNKLPPSKPYSFTSRDGVKILVGKNNRQNDMLTLGTANPDDIWLHTKSVHGSHVIIKRSGQVPDSTLYDAAMLAAYYSKARGSSNVPVDYTEVRYIKKPSGSKPGMVIYSRQHTLYVTPDAEHIKKLMQ